MRGRCRPHRAIQFVLQNWATTHAALVWYPAEAQPQHERRSYPILPRVALRRAVRRRVPSLCLPPAMLEYQGVEAECFQKRPDLLYEYFERLHRNDCVEGWAPFCVAGLKKSDIDQRRIECCKKRGQVSIVSYRFAHSGPPDFRSRYHGLSPDSPELGSA